ncbi:MAG: hypothetical protein OHK93_008385 [Ramalina farinacea]|uniref:Uncharacterized protein n=1 Tax=Ramalina farinacea TaxID=258253 RepID=A0AA43TYG8_9LECA|nr:hypothetical protein [Ramalina farinacea]
MKYVALLPAFFGAHALSAGVPYSPAGSQGSSINPQDNSTAMPLPKPGQSVADFLDIYFPDDDDDGDEGQGEESQPDLTKRNYTESKGIVTSKWTNVTGTVEQDYEIDLDLSPCDSGLNFSTEVGVFTSATGITANVTLRDILDNIWSNHYSRRQRVNTKWAAQICQVAELAMQEANELLTSRLLCNHSLPADTSAAIYPYTDPALGVSLRKLQQNAKAYWLTTIAGSVTAGLVFAGAAAGLQHWYQVNITKLNVIQTGLVVGGAAMTGGILNRCWAVGRLDTPANALTGVAVAGGQAVRAGGQAAANNVRAGGQAAANNVPNPQQMLRAVAPQAHEALVQNVYLAWFRALLRRIARRERRQVEVALAANPGGNPAENPVGNPAGITAGDGAAAGNSAGNTAGGAAGNTVGNAGGDAAGDSAGNAAASSGSTVVNIGSGNSAGAAAGNTGDTVINIGDFHSAGSGSSIDYQSAASGSSFDFGNVGPDPGTCLSPDDAAQAAQEMQDMELEDWGIETLDETKFVPGQGIPPDCAL